MMNASRQIHSKEDVELKKWGHDEEDGVKSEWNEAHFPVKNEFVGHQNNVEYSQGRDEHNGGVLQSNRIDFNEVLTMVFGNHGCLDEPG